MSPLAIGLISTGCIFGGALLGLWLQTVMPGHHLRDSSKDAVKLAAGVIATVAALVLGLLISSAKSSRQPASRCAAASPSRSRWSGRP